MSVSKNPQSGFSMIEMLVAVVILAVGLLGLAQLQVTAIKANSQSATSTAATALAQKGIEVVMSWDSKDPKLTNEQLVPTNLYGTDPPITVPGAGTYTVTYTVETSYQGKTGLSRVIVEVKSTQAVMGVLGNKTRSVVLHALRRTG